MYSKIKAAERELFDTFLLSYDKELRERHKQILKMLDEAFQIQFVFSEKVAQYYEEIHGQLIRTAYPNSSHKPKPGEDPVPIELDYPITFSYLIDSMKEELRIAY